MNEINTYQHDWFLIEISPDKLVYTNATSEKIYDNRRDSTNAIYTMTIYFTGTYKKRASEAIIKVHSSSRAIEQETKIIHLHGDYNLLDEIIDNLNAMDLPLF